VLADRTSVELLGNVSSDGQRTWQRVLAPGEIIGWVDEALLESAGQADAIP
jgi:hypothetical protein